MMDTEPSSTRGTNIWWNGSEFLEEEKIKNKQLEV